MLYLICLIRRTGLYLGRHAMNHEESFMKLKTRLTLTAFVTVILPLVLTACAFIVLSLYQLKFIYKNYGIETEYNYEVLTNSVQAFSRLTRTSYNTLQQLASSDPDRFQDIGFLAQFNEKLSSKSSYLVLRAGDNFYYIGNEEDSLELLAKLPGLGYGDSENDTQDYYFGEEQRLVKKVDITFSDGSTGIAYIITKLSSLTPVSYVVNLVIAVTFILIITSIFTTRETYRSVVKPVRKLSEAMRNISEGNLDFSIATEGKDEFCLLCNNFDEMRKRLKDSTETKVRYDTENRELISNISHDLKTPITAIKGYVEGIMDGVADTPEKMDRYIKTIYNKANEMDRLINELTLYSKIDTNRIPYNFHRINVNDYFNDCIEEIGLDLESKNITLNYSNYVDSSTRIIADPEQLRRVVSNIIGNSVKYMDKPDGSIEIRINDNSDSIQVEIEDNGKGIAQKDLLNIFDRFFRTDASRNSSQGGSGIGLSIVKKIIEDHGGYIWATSRENVGTTIHFVLRKYQEVLENE